MSGGYPHLFPAGFVEFEEPSRCELSNGAGGTNDVTGPIMYRSQPSRENSYAPTLNDFMNKYSTGTTNYNFLRTLENLKYFSRHWHQIPEKTRNEIVRLLKESTSDMATALGGSGGSDNNNRWGADALLGNGGGVEHFGNGNTNCSGASSSSSEVIKLIITFIIAAFVGYIIGTLRD